VSKECHITIGVFCLAESADFFFLIAKMCEKAKVCEKIFVVENIIAFGKKSYKI